MYDFNKDINAKDSQGLTPLMYASRRNKEKVVDMLTLRSDNLNEEDSNYQTILMQRLLDS